MTEIRVPQLNSNDTSYVLLDWRYDDGQEVPAGEPVVEVETSKATEELVADSGGVLHRLVPVRGECHAGQVIGRLFETEADRLAFLAAAGSGAAAPAPDAVVITAGARSVAEAHGVGLDRLRALGRTLVRAADVEKLLARAESARDTGAAGSRVRELPAQQRTVAAVVTESHRTVPDAYVAVRVRVAAALEYAQTVAAGTERPVGLADLLIRAVARRHATYPLFFASPRADGTVMLSDAAHVGVTVDVGRGLFVPVVRDAASRPWEDLADLLMGYRIAAMRGDFRAADLAGGTVTVSLHNTGSVVQAVPIVFPGQTCVVSLCATREELRLAEDGRPVAEPVVDIGLAYDHRVINGREAVEFLTAIQADLEQPGSLEPEPPAAPVEPPVGAGSTR